MAYIVLFVILLIVFYIGFKVVFLRRLKKEKYEKLTQVRYFSKKFKIKKQSLYNKKFCKSIALINSLIISFVGTIVMYLDIVWKFNYFIELIVGFILLFLLLYSLYEIYGRQLKRKEDMYGNKNK